jgi:hypothetical protein
LGVDRLDPEVNANACHPAGGEAVVGEPMEERRFAHR